MIQTILIPVAAFVILILLVRLFQYGPGRALVRALFWVANRTTAVARGADEYIAGYHAHLTRAKLVPVHMDTDRDVQNLQIETP